MVKSRINTGCVIFWSASEWTDICRLKAGWEPIGLGNFVPEQRPPLACLRDALTEVVANNHVLIRPLASKTGFCAVKEQRGTDDNSYEPLFSARVIDGQAEPVFSVTNEDTEKVLLAYRKFVGRLTSQQLSAALVKVIGEFGGTRLRPTGGVYWLAGDRIGAWEEVTEAVADAADGGKSVAYVVEHELDTGSVAAVRDALVAEVTAETQRISREIQSGDLGERAIESRKNEAALLKRKVIEYEAILDVTLDSLKKGLDSINQSQAIAALLLSAGPFPIDNLTEEPAHASVA